MIFLKNITTSPVKAYQMMTTENDFVLLDVRAQEEYIQSHIDGATLIPADELNRRAESELPDEDSLILVYCHSGMRAGRAAKLLDRMGYTNVFSFGGMINWPYKTVKR